MYRFLLIAVAGILAWGALSWKDSRRAPVQDREESRAGPHRSEMPREKPPSSQQLPPPPVGSRPEKVGVPGGAPAGALPASGPAAAVGMTVDEMGFQRSPHFNYRLQKVPLTGGRGDHQALVAVPLDGEVVVPFEEMRTSCEILNLRQVPVSLMLKVDARGEVMDAVVPVQLQGRDAVPVGPRTRACRFEPYERNGQPVAVTVIYDPRPRN
jgi:hypothetical protein